MIKVPLKNSQRITPQMASIGLNARRNFKGWKEKKNQLYYIFAQNEKIAKKLRVQIGIHPLYFRACTSAVAHRRLQNIEIIAVGTYWLHTEYDKIMGYIVSTPSIKITDVNYYNTIEDPGKHIYKEGDKYFINAYGGKLIVGKRDKVFIHGKDIYFIRDGDLTPTTIDGGIKLPIRGYKL